MLRTALSLLLIVCAAYSSVAFVDSLCCVQLCSYGAGFLSGNSACLQFEPGLPVSVVLVGVVVFL